MSEVNKQPARVPLVDPNTGLVTREWYKFFEQVFIRGGGTYAPTNGEIDNQLQFDVREAEAGELAKRLSDLERYVVASDAPQAMALLSEMAKQATWKEVEIDLGSIPRKDFKFTITDPRITSRSRVAVMPSGKPATGRGSDDWQWDTASFAANPASGQATVYALFTGRVVGKRNIQYLVN